jgi:hypothetical protein
MFDLRKEAEMRLHSEKVAKELALRRKREDADEEQEPTGTTVVVDAEPGG